MAEMRIGRLTKRLEALRRQMRELQAMERAVADAPDHQVSLTDPDARAMATNGKGTGMVGYNVQTVVDAKHHLIIAHEVTNVGHDKHQLAHMARAMSRQPGRSGVADRIASWAWSISRIADSRPAADHPACDLALSPVHPELPRRGRAPRRTRSRYLL